LRDNLIQKEANAKAEKNQVEEQLKSRETWLKWGFAIILFLFLAPIFARVKVQPTLN
jgi:hypothetical protein